MKSNVLHRWLEGFLYKRSIDILFTNAFGRLHCNIPIENSICKQTMQAIAVNTLCIERNFLLGLKSFDQFWSQSGEDFCDKHICFNVKLDRTGVRTRVRNHILPIQSVIHPNPNKV